LLAASLCAPLILDAKSGADPLTHGSKGFLIKKNNKLKKLNWATALSWRQTRCLGLRLRGIHIRKGEQEEWTVKKTILVWMLGSLALCSAPGARADLTEQELEQQVQALQGQVNQLQTVVNFLRRELDTLGVGTRIKFDSTHNAIVITGANLQVVNGMGSTATTNGTGNLIVGYNEVDPYAVVVCSNASIPTTGPGSWSPYNQGGCPSGAWGANQRQGSHNLVVGLGHSYTQFGGIVVGADNAITNPYSSVSGGAGNTADGQYSSVSGGSSNVAAGSASSVSGGGQSIASGVVSSVSGGALNNAGGDWGSVSGGLGNFATGENSSVSGGWANSASGFVSSVLGGNGNNASAQQSSVSGGQFSTASGFQSSVSGGYSNTASGPNSSVSGGIGNTAGASFTSVSGGASVSDGTTNGWAAGTLRQ
jgi:hypothetical protein